MQECDFNDNNHVLVDVEIFARLHSVGIIGTYVNIIHISVNPMCE